MSAYRSTRTPTRKFRRTRRFLTFLASAAAVVLTVGLAPPPATAAEAAGPEPATAPPVTVDPAATERAATEPRESADAADSARGTGESLGRTSEVDPAAEGSGGDAPAPAAVPADAAGGSDLADLRDPTGGDDAAAPAASTTDSGPVTGVADEVREAVADDGSAPVLIRLREQADPQALSQAADAAASAAAASAAREAHGARGAGDRVADAAHQARTRSVVRSLQQHAEEHQPAVRELLETHADAGRAADIRPFWVYNGFAATVDAAVLDELAAHPQVQRVTLDEAVSLPTPEPADTDPPALPEWTLERIDAPDVWGEYGVRGDDVVVGVMDSGVDAGHPALAESWRGADGDPEKSWAVPTGESYPEPGDGNGHGTHVTGSIVGAPPGDVTGVAPEAEWIAAKIFTDSGASSDSIIHAGFEWMLAPGGDPTAAPHVVNNSWGSDASNSREYWDAVAAWEAAGIVPIFANGNAGPGAGTVGAPASYPHSIGIGATDADDVLAGFSSRGPVTWDGEEYTKPELSAPGHAVRSTWPRQLSEDGYNTISGTSMAAPHATGVVALLRAAAPGLSVDEVREALVDTVRTTGRTEALPNGYGAGIVDAHAAVTRVTRSGLVTGTVTDEDGAPVAATVTSGGHTAESDPETGQLRLWLPAGGHELTVEAYGHESWTGEVQVTAGDTTAVSPTLATTGQHSLTGRVTDTVGAVPGARVALPDTPVAPARTGPDGRFALTVAAGTHTLRVTAPGRAPATEQVTVSGDTDTEVALVDSVAPAAPGWAQHQNNPARTGRSQHSAAAETLEPQWDAPAGGAVTFANPVVDDDTVFVNADGELAALARADGTEQWRFEGSPAMRGTPAVADGTVYTGGGEDGGVYALDAETGEQLWHVPTPQQRTIYTSPAVADGVVYAATGYTADHPDAVYALDADTGEERWSTEVGTRVFFGPAVADGLVVATSAGDGDGGRIVALDADTGEQEWELTHERDEFIAGPAVADGTVYATTTAPQEVGEWRGNLLAVDADTGQLRWETPHGDGQGSTPAVHGDLVIAGSHGLGTVAAYDRASGEPVWHYGLDVSGAVSASVAVTGDGYVVGGSQLDQRVFALDADTGEQVFSHPVGANVLGSPALADGQLITTESDGTVRAFASTGAVTGTVTAPDGPVASATARLVGTDLRADSTENGEFTLDSVPPGEYTLAVSAFGYTSDTSSVQVRAGQQTTVEVALEPVGDGALTGTVTDAAGDPLPGAEVALVDTPLDPVTTGDDGGYGFDPVAAGTYTLRVTADGYATAEPQVNVPDGETATVDVSLERYEVAVVSDHESRVTQTLTDAGWRVERVSFDAVDGTVDRYQAVVVVGDDEDRADADPERFGRLVDDADDAGTSLVFLDTGGPSYGSMRTLSEVTGDPAEEDATLFNRGGVWLTDVVDHPVTAGLPEGDRVPLLASDSWYAWFDDYSGDTLATLGSDGTGPVGSGIGYQRRTLASNHILLPALAPSPFAQWEPAAEQLLVDAVDHAAGAAYGAVTGAVTDADQAAVEARVEVVGGREETVADGDGSFRLMLEPGEHTLRLTHPGSEPVELPVTVTAGETTHHDVTMPPAPYGTLAGTVAEPDGAPVVGAEVTVAGTDAAATSNGDGRYTVTGLSGGTYDVTVTAGGYEATTVTDVDVAGSGVTTLDVTLDRAPGVAVLGDYSDDITEFLEGHEIPVRQAGWEITDDLAGVEVVIVHDPADIDREEFLAALEAFDTAGVSVLFPADGWSSRTSGVEMLVEHTGNPPDYGRLGGFNGPEIALHDLADHPVFEGVDDDPAPLLTEESSAAYFPEYSGVTLAEVAAGDDDPAGIGVAYDPRTPDSVHLLLSGLASTFRNDPQADWTAQGQQIFLNAVRWAAEPAQGGVTGTVTGPDGIPVPDAEVSVVDTSWNAVTGADGGFDLALPPGEYTVRYDAFGYQATEQTVQVAAGDTVDASTSLALDDVGAITGVVHEDAGDGGIGPTADGDPLAGASVTLRDTPYATETDEDGEYGFTRVEPGTYELALATDGYVRTFAEVTVDAGGTTDRDVGLRPSPTVGVVDDSDYSGTRDRAKQFLTDWGYEAVDVGFGEHDRIRELDLVVANVSDFSLELTAGQLAAFEETVNRARVPVLWLGQDGRGAIQFLQEHQDDPAVLHEGDDHGSVTATVSDGDHPLVAGLPDEFPLMEPDRRYSSFDEFSGETVASLTTGDEGARGDTVAYRGRTADAVDVLLSTLTVTTWGAPAADGNDRRYWTPQAERLLVNALAWALDADGVGGHVRGTVTSDADSAPLASEVEVRETGRTYQGRGSDGTFLVPLPPGTWTLDIDAFGHADETVEVTVEPGEEVTRAVTLSAEDTGAVAGTVTGPDGEPVADAEVTVPGTPHSATTGADGGYTVDRLPAGDWTLRVAADGYRTAETDVTVTPGTTVSGDVRLAATAHVAIVDSTGSSSYGTALAGLLGDGGYEVELMSRSGMADLADEVDEYDVVIFNATIYSSYEEPFQATVDAAAEAGVSTVFPSQYGGAHAIPQLAEYRDDPGTVDWGFVDVGIDYLPETDHPIFDGFDEGTPVELITSNTSNQNQQYGSFDDWSGQTIARVTGRTDGADLGGGVGYRFSSSTSVELLLGGLAASSHGSPAERWTDEAQQIYLNAVGWAVDARQAQLTGVVTGGGDPLPEATVTATEAGTTTVTGEDGSYTLGLTAGTYTVEVAAHGYATATETVDVPAEGTVTLDVDLEPLPRGPITGEITDEATGAPVAGVELTGDGPTGWQATTGDDGRYAAEDLLGGAYEVTIEADGYLPQTATVTLEAPDTATLDAVLTPTDVGVLGDPDDALTTYLRGEDVPAAALSWQDATGQDGYEVIVVNGGEPDADTFAAVLDAADEAETSLLFTGTWATDRGGLPLLAAHTDRVTIGERGYGDGPVQLSGYDTDHPVFAGLPADEATLITDGGYYSVLDEYAGEPLAQLSVPRDSGDGDGADPVTGLAVGWDWRTADSVEMVLSASAVTDAVGPGQGWTEHAGTLVVDAIAWAREAALAPPEAPTLQPEAPAVTTETVTVHGDAEPAAEITVRVDGDAAATTTADDTGAWTVDVPLPVGDADLTAVATNLAGTSPPSAAATVARWEPDWRVRGRGPARPVTLNLSGAAAWPPPADEATLVVRDADGEVVTRTTPRWRGGAYRGVVHGLPRHGEYTLHAELVVDGHRLVIDGPALR